VAALRGSLTYARFYVEGDPPDDLRERFMRSIRLRAMRPLEPEDEDLERSGWCKIGEPFVTDLGYEDVFFNSFLNLGFRTDRWQIPGSMLRRHVREAEAAYLEKKGRERLSRKEKTELKLLVAKKLRKQTAPQTRSVDLSWSLEERIVRFFGHAAKPAGLMTELFTKTFNLTLVPESPYTLAARIGLSKPQDKRWQDLEMTYLAGVDLVRGGARGRVTDEAAEEEEE
jgi:recombination associated protein RdgC